MLLHVGAIKKSFGADEVLTGVSFRIDRREKVALVGRNGTGKSTLLKIITGQMEPDSGSVMLARGAKVGYLKQENPLGIGRSVLQEAEEARRESIAIKNRLEELEKEMESGASAEDLEEYATLHEHYMEMEGYSADRDLRTVLARMGFDESEFDKPASKLSGGEKTRLALTRLLLEQPDLLLLDEPTNHLDLQATEWMEGWLRSYTGAVLLVSHDRAFLDGFGDTVLDLREGAVKSYPGPFRKYLKLREEEETRQAEVAKRQLQEIERMDEYVRRFINSQRTAQARGRQKQMNKLIASAVVAPKAEKGMKAGFTANQRSGDTAWDLKRVSMNFGSLQLFKDLDWTVRFRERWGVVGENGAGKSTLIRIALGLLEPSSGGARLGTNVSAGYFAQDTVNLNLDQSPLDYLVWEYDILPADARNLLGRFLITGDDVFRPIRTLSGGEKNKLALACLTTLHPNLLVLDEPTNHLDMDSREALAEVLCEYNGTLVLVSHDRWLLEQVTDHTLDLRRSGAVIYNGSYGEYHRSESRIGLDSSAPVGKPPTNAARQMSSELSQKQLSKEISRIEREIADLEEEIHETENEILLLEQTLASLPADADVLALTRSHGSLQERLSGQMAVWEELGLELEGLRARQGS